MCVGSCVRRASITRSMDAVHGKTFTGKCDASRFDPLNLKVPVTTPPRGGQLLACCERDAGGLLAGCGRDVTVELRWSDGGVSVELRWESGVFHAFPPISAARSPNMPSRASHLTGPITVGGIGGRSMGRARVCGRGLSFSNVSTITVPELLTLTVPATSSMSSTSMGPSLWPTARI
jgi:hypothetical protein